jgi:hypothetical protein
MRSWRSLSENQHFLYEKAIKAFGERLNRAGKNSVGLFADLARIKIDELSKSRVSSSGDEVVAMIEAKPRGFKAGTYKPKILSATADCREISLGKMQADSVEINGKWSYAQGGGKISITQEKELVDVNWSGSLMLETRDLVQFSGTSLLVKSEIRHMFGICTISFKLVEILDN